MKIKPFQGLREREKPPQKEENEASVQQNHFKIIAIQGGKNFFEKKSAYLNKLHKKMLHLHDMNFLSH
jgi:hypothetical protein